MATVKVKNISSVKDTPFYNRIGHTKTSRHISAPLYFDDYMCAQIEQMKRDNRWGTAKNYEKVLANFSLFMHGRKLPLHMFNEQIVTEYNSYLIGRGLIRNSVSFYMRILRAVYNRAVRQKLVTQTHPFDNVYTGIDHTRKRAVNEQIVAAINKLNLTDDPTLALARDLFIFSYCTRGMAFVDMAYLKKDNIHNGAICYTRRKTGQMLTIRIEPVIQQIIARYHTPLSHYIFPIITSSNEATAYTQYTNGLNIYNRMLRKLSSMLPYSPIHLTSYTARHSWATAARNHQVPISVISAGMGHNSEMTTRIYLDSMENSVIDDANHMIIGEIFRR